MSNAIITPRKYSSVGAIKRALAKAGTAEVPQRSPLGMNGDSVSHPSLSARGGTTVGPSRVPSFRSPDLDAENDAALDGQGAPIPGNPSFPRRRVPNSPTRTGF